MQTFDFIKLIDSFSLSYNKLHVIENFKYFEAKYRLNDFCRASLRKSLPACFAHFEDVSDNVIFQIDFSCGESFSSVGDFDDFLDEVDEWASEEEYEPIVFIIKIEKNITDNCLNLYSFYDFESYLKTQNLRDRFDSWSFFDLAKKAILLSHRDFCKVTTYWLELRGASDNSVVEECVNNEIRGGCQSKRDSASHFANASEFSYIPEDFEVIEGMETSLGECLNSIHNALLLIYLSDYSEIFDSGVKYSMNGYKTVSGFLRLKDLESYDFSELKGIYKYVFVGGSFTDKIGLARNVMSLHMSGNSLCELESGTLASVRSGYNVYLKDNIKQYIDIKNKLLEFLRDQSDKAADVGRGLFSSFKMKFWAFSTFFVSVFLLRSLSKSTGDFVDEKVVIPGIVLVSVSLVYLVIMIREGRYEEKVIREKFDDIKLRYRDLLDERDLETILDSEENKEKVSRTISDAINIYRNAWIGTSVLFLFVLLWWWKSTAGITLVEMFSRIFGL